MEYKKFKTEAVNHAKSYIKKRERKGYYGDSLLPKLLLVLIFELSENNRLLQLSKQKLKRAPSAWQKFTGEKLKEGYSMKEIARKWKEEK